MNNPLILVIEDEESIRDLLRFILSTNQFDIMEAEDAKTAYQKVTQRRPDLILLDWMLPKESGIEIAKLFKSDALTQNIPIIMLTARAEEDNKVEALGLGADDYIVKPFSPRELIARIHAVLRREQKTQDKEKKQIYKINELILDATHHRVTIAETNIELRPLEFRLLHFFIAHVGRIYTRQQLLDYVWGQDSYVDERTIDATIKRLRQALKIKNYDRCVETIRSVGYRFVPYE